jgi:hypothetical protein
MGNVTAAAQASKILQNKFATNLHFGIAIGENIVYNHPCSKCNQFAIY